MPTQLRMPASQALRKRLLGLLGHSVVAAQQLPAVMLATLLAQIEQPLRGPAIGLCTWLLKHARADKLQREGKWLA